MSESIVYLKRAKQIMPASLHQSPVASSAFLTNSLIFEIIGEKASSDTKKTFEQVKKWSSTTNYQL